MIYAAFFYLGPFVTVSRPTFGRNQKQKLPKLKSISRCSNISPCQGGLPVDSVVAIWEAFYIENKRFDLDTLRVPNRSPTPTSKSNDFPGRSEDIWGARGLHLRPILGVPGVRAGFKHTDCLALR